MAEDLRGHGVRVSAVCPGSVATDFGAGRDKKKPNALEPDDVAHAVETIVTQAPGSFVSEIHIRPLKKS
jgi:short-subunit dehydrogenase